MTRTDLRVDMTADDTALLRLLGVVRRRGFAVRAIEAQELGECSLGVSMTIESARPVEVLVRQIDRIVGVQRVSVSSPPTPPVETGGASGVRASAVA